MQEFEPRYTESEQRRIIEEAARLQKEQQETLSEQELIAAAAEAGIAPQFVQAATRRVSSTASSKKASNLPPAALVLAPLLVVSQWFGLFSMMTGRFQQLAGLQWWLVFGVCFCLGSVLSHTRRLRLLAVGITLASVLILTLLCGGFVGLTGSVTSNWPIFLRNIILAEVLATMLGGLLGQALSRLPRFAQDAGPVQP